MKFDCEDEPNEFMEMPCRCDCGKWFDLNDGYANNDSNKVVCRECKDKLCKHVNSGFVGVVGEIFCDDCQSWIS